jgi:archaellum component FlaF (FlaF/FlaG flagellin family)
MKQDSLVSMDAKTIHARSNKRRSGFGTVVSSLIMVVAVAILGSVVLIWANSSLGVQQKKIANDYETNSNLLKENLVIEDIWLSKSLTNPQNYVNVTLRNIGDISIAIKEVKIVSLGSNGVPTGCANCTRTMTSSFPNNGVIDSKQTLKIDVDNINWNNSGINYRLDISVTTQRGTIEKILWMVRP